MAKPVNQIPLPKRVPMETVLRDDVMALRASGYASKTESRYADYLSQLVALEVIKSYIYQPFKLILAHKTTYTPDFLVDRGSGPLEVIEVKGSWSAPHQGRSRVKLMWAAQKYYFFKFYSVTPGKKYVGVDPWKSEWINPATERTVRSIGDA